MNRFINFLGVFVRQCCWLGALGLVLAALYISLGRQLVPWVAEYRLEVQDKAQEVLAMPVALGRLEGRWQGFAPRLLAHDVLLGEGDGAMRLDRLALVPDLFGSLWARELRLASLEFDGVQLSLTQNAAGKWQVQGLPNRADQPPPDPQKALVALQRIQRLALVNSQITFEPYGESPLTLTYANFQLRASRERLRLDGRVILPDGLPLALNLQARVQPQRWEQAEAELYLNLPQSDWAAWLPRRLMTDWRLERLQAGGEFWASWRDQALARAVLRLHGPEIRGAYAERAPVTVENLALNAYAERSTEGYRILLDGLAFSLGDSRWGDARILLAATDDRSQWRLQADRLDIAPLAALVRASAPLPETVAQTLDALQPSGRLRNLAVDFKPAAVVAERLRFAADLDGVSFGAHNWIPAAQNVTGQIQGDLAGGQVQLDSRGFSLHLARLFPEPWHYHEGRGRLTWHLDQQAVTLAAPYLQIEGDEGRLAADFLIRLMRDPEAEDYMDLRVGLSDSNASYMEKYLPTRSPALSPVLAKWLREAIHGGALEQGYFQYQGALNKGADETARSLGLYFKVHEAELAFQPGWPALREASGEVLIEDSGVRVRLAEGRILDSRVHEVTAAIPRGQDQSLRLALQGQVESSLGDGLKLLQKAPIGTQQIFAGWEGEGLLSGTLDLDIPLGEGRPPRVKVAFSSAGATLLIPEPELKLKALGGNFRYDSDKGLSANNLHARAFGRALRGSAVAIGAPGSPATRIEAQGSIELKRLVQWLDFQQPVPASGELPYQLQLTLDGSNSQLQVDSSLLGLALDLPAPFAKPAGERRDTSLHMTLRGAERYYGIQHADLAALAFAAPAGAWTEGRGELRLGGRAANLPLSKGLRIRGRLASLNWTAWQAVRERYAREDGGQAALLLNSARLHVNRFEGFGTHIEGLDLHLRRSAAAWALGLDSATIAGDIRLPDASGAAIGVDLARLRLPASADPAAGAAAGDPLASIDPRSLPAMDIAVAQVSLGDNPLGAWALKLRPVSDGVVFSELNIDLKGLKVGGSAGWQGSQSWYKGRLQGENLADVLLAWGFAPSTTSEDFRLDVDGRWPGSPANIALERFSGSLEARLRNGQLREIEGGAQALRMFGLLNFDSIGRRLRLDFSDLFGKGLSYDRIKGLLVAADGIYRTDEPIVITGPSSNLELDGQLNMVSDRIDAQLLVTLPLSNNLPLAALLVGAPAIGGALFVVDKLLGDQVARFATVRYNVEGPWQSPKISFDKPFE